MARTIAAHPPRRLAGGKASSPRERSARGPLGLAHGAAGALRAGVLRVRRTRRLRLALLALTITLVVLAGGWLLLRHSPFVSIERVQISGVHGADAAAVEAALTHAAKGMSTLDVSRAGLQAAVAPLRVVREVRAIPSFPHGLRIEVVEQLPVASLTVAGRSSGIGQRTAVAADGVVLGAGLLSGELPSISGSHVAPAAGRRVSGAGLMAELSVLGAAPAPLLAHAERVFTGAKGLTVAMRNGLLVYFGDDTRPHAKWLSLARVLADPSSAGAAYVDVRLPSHPAAGFPAGVSSPDATNTTGSTATEQPGSDYESTVASLAAALPGGGGTGSSTSDEPAASDPSAPATEAASAPQASTGAPTEAPTEATPGG